MKQHLEINQGVQQLERVNLNKNICTGVTHA